MTVGILRFDTKALTCHACIIFAYTLHLFDLRNKSGAAAARGVLPRKLRDGRSAFIIKHQLAAAVVVLQYHNYCT
jgi:hypothetical protein